MHLRSKSKFNNAIKNLNQAVGFLFDFGDPFGAGIGARDRMLQGK